MSSRTSPSSPFGSWPGVLTAPSTPTALTEGTARPSPEKYGSRSLLPNPPPSSMMAMVWPVPSVPAGKLYSPATCGGV